MKRRPSCVHSHPAAHADHPTIHPSPTNRRTHPCSDPCLYRRSHAACVYFGGADRSTRPKRRAQTAALRPPLLLYCSRALPRRTARATSKRLCQSANNNNSCLMARRPAGIFPVPTARRSNYFAPAAPFRQASFTSGISQRARGYL